MRSNLTVKKPEDYDNIVEKVSTMIESDVKGLIDEKKTGKLTTINFNDIKKQLNAAGNATLSPLKINSTQEAKLKEMYGFDSKNPSNSDVNVVIGESLPGGKTIIACDVVLKVNNMSDMDEALKGISKLLKNTRCVLGNDRYSPRDVSEGDVKTLTTSQIDKVCDDVIEIAELSYTHEKAWERRDKFQAKLERDIDQIVKEVNQEDHEKVDSTAQRSIRQYAESFTAAVRRRTTFESQFISYALNTASAMLNYSERSLAQHKSK